MLKTVVVMPAYNEAARILDVLRAVTQAPSIDEVVVVNDGSTDNTAEVVAAFPGVRLVDLKVNAGKGGAMSAGAASTDADVLVFLDSDLIGLSPDHVEALVSPVRSGRAQMAVGRFQGGRKLTDWSQRLAPNISGQRAMLREVFVRIPDISRTRFGVEMAITRFCRYHRVTTETVRMPGVTHPMKEEKLGLVRGWTCRARMYCEIMRILMDRRAPRDTDGRPPNRTLGQRLLRRARLKRLREDRLARRSGQAPPSGASRTRRRRKRPKS